MPFTLGGSPLAHIGGGIPFAYRASSPIYIGTTPMVVSSDEFPLIPLVPDITPPTVAMPGFEPRRRFRRKLRMRHKDREVEASNSRDLAAKMRALLMEELNGDVAAVEAAIETSEIHVDLTALDAYLDFGDGEEDDEMAVLYAIAESIDT
jgi:hypothetical protein